jgi:hypothetical protein
MSYSTPRHKGAHIGGATSQPVPHVKRRVIAIAPRATDLLWLIPSASQRVMLLMGGGYSRRGAPTPHQRKPIVDALIGYDPQMTGMQFAWAVIRRAITDAFSLVSLLALLISAYWPLVAEQLEKHGYKVAWGWPEDRFVRWALGIFLCSIACARYLPAQAGARTKVHRSTGAAG